MPVIPLECPSCGTGLRIDSDESATICTRCGKPFVVKDAIVENYIKIVTDREAEQEKALTFEEFITDGDVLRRYNGTSPVITVPDNIKIIGSKAFEDRREIAELRLPESVEVIEDNAFAGCTGLQKICFPGALKKIGSYAFSECTDLMEAAIPASIEEIGSYAFSGCFSLTSVKMPSSQSRVHETAFTGAKDVVFEWPSDWTRKQLDKLKIVAPTQGGMIALYDSDGECGSVSEPLLYLGISDLGMYVESGRYCFYTYKGFMNMFSIDKNNNDPYLLRKSIESAGVRYDAISDIQKSYSELIGLLDRAKIRRSDIETINIPHFILRPGKRLNDYRIVDTGVVPVLQIRLIQE